PTPVVAVAAPAIEPPPAPPLAQKPNRASKHRPTSHEIVPHADTPALDLRQASPEIMAPAPAPAPAATPAVIAYMPAVPQPAGPPQDTGHSLAGVPGVWSGSST